MARRMSNVGMRQSRPVQLSCGQFNAWTRLFHPLFDLATADSRTGTNTGSKPLPETLDSFCIPDQAVARPVERSYVAAVRCALTSWNRCDENSSADASRRSRLRGAIAHASLL